MRQSKSNKAEVKKELGDLPKTIPQSEVQALAESIARKIIAEQNAVPAQKYAYPEIENAHVTVIRFGKNSDAAKAYDLLARQPKAQLYIPLDFGGKELRGRHWHRYQLNGLILWIDKGEMVEVPQTVYEDMRESIVDTERALNPMVVDGDGRLVSAQMAGKPSVGEFARS